MQSSQSTTELQVDLLVPGPVVVTDLDFTKNIALLSELINPAQDLLIKVELSAGKIGLVMNAKKTKVMAFNHDEEVKIITQDWSQLEVVQDFVV